MRIDEEGVRTFRRYAVDGRVVVFDTETTGGSCYDEICQIAAAEYVGGVRTRTFCEYVRPSCEMNPYAQMVHGLSMEFLAVHGLEPEEAMHRFFAFLGRDTLLVAHNNRFDMRMLVQECEKFALGLELPEDIETCDTLALARRLRPGLSSYKLADLMDTLGVAGDNSHDALDDTLACAGVFFSLLRGR